MSAKRTPHVVVANERYYLSGHPTGLKIPCSAVLSPRLHQLINQKLWKDLSEKDRVSFLRVARLVEVRCKEVWVEAALETGWTAAYRIVGQDGEPVIGEVRILPSEPERFFPFEKPPSIPHYAGRWWGAFKGTQAQVPPGGLSTRILRQGARSRPVTESLGELSARLTEGVGIAKTIDLLVGMIHRKRGAPRGRRPRPALEYARIAKLYVNARLKGSYRPVVAVAKARRISVKLARDLIHKARRHGFLTDTTKQGRAGGALTSLTKATLKQHRSKGRRRHGTKR